MHKLLTIDPYLTPLEALAARIQSLDLDSRQTLLSLCDSAFSNVTQRLHEATRVAAAKCMVALVPYSGDTIIRWIKSTSGRGIYEVHFSLFCFIDRIPDMPDSDELAGRVPALIEQYLLTVKSKAAFAAWMAGDLLGDHWQIEHTLPVLQKAAEQARFVAGRSGALHGLAHIFNRLPVGDPARDFTFALIRKRANEDRSRKLRDTAKLILEGKLCLELQDKESGRT